MAQIHYSIRAPAGTKQRGSFLTSSISIFISAKRTEPLLPSAWPWKKTKIKKEMIQQATLFLQFEFFFLPSSYFFFSLTDLYKAIRLLKSRCLFEINLEFIRQQRHGEFSEKINFTTNRIHQTVLTVISIMASSCTRQ